MARQRLREVIECFSESYFNPLFSAHLEFFKLIFNIIFKLRKLASYLFFFLFAWLRGDFFSPSFVSLYKIFLSLLRCHKLEIFSSVPEK